MQIRVQFFVHNANAGKHFIYLWIPIKSPSRDMSFTPRMITYSAQMSDLKKQHAKSVFLSQLNRIQSNSRLKIRDLPVLQHYLWHLLSWSYCQMHLQIFGIIFSLFCTRIFVILKRSYFWVVFIQPPANFQKSSKIDIFCLSIAKICKPHRTVGWWYK